MQLLSQPPSVSRQTEWRFIFQCFSEISGCSFMCSVHTTDSSAQFSTCSGTWMATSLENGRSYEFIVVATDGVGNIASPLTYQWKIGEFFLSVSLHEYKQLLCVQTLYLQHCPC